MTTMISAVQPETPSSARRMRAASLPAMMQTEMGSGFLCRHDAGLNPKSGRRAKVKIPPDKLQRHNPCEAMNLKRP